MFGLLMAVTLFLAAVGGLAALFQWGSFFKTKLTEKKSGGEVKVGPVTIKDRIEPTFKSYNAPATSVATTSMQPSATQTSSGSVGGLDEIQAFLNTPVCMENIEDAEVISDEIDNFFIPDEEWEIILGSQY